MIRRFQFCITTTNFNYHKNFFLRFISTSEQFVGGTGNTNSADPQENSSSQKAKTCTIVADFTTTCPFTCLGLTHSASKEQVRENFLQLAKVHHPDVGGAATKFKRINAAYKQSIQQIETGYAAKIAAEMKAKKEKEEEEKNAYKAPHEREENYNNTNSSRTPADSSDRSKTSYYSASSTSYYKNKYANPERTSNFSSASSYSSAERHHSNHQSGTSSGERNASSRYFNDFMSRNTTSATTSEKEGKEFIRNSQMRDERAKSHNRSDDWFKEMYESSWGSKKSSNKTSERKSDEKHNSNSETRKESENKKQDEKSNQNKSSSSTFSSSSTDQEFDSDEGWFEFRENFFRSAAHSFSPRDMYRFRFSQATTVKEIDEIYNQAMTENIFSGYDIGEPLHLALERYHLELGLGEKHLEKCFEKIDDWEARTKSRAGCIYYQCILKIYTNERMLMLFPDMDASMAAEVVWKTLEKMQQNEVSDDTGIAWWNVLNSSLMYRDRHGYSYSP